MYYLVPSVSKLLFYKKVLCVLIVHPPVLVMVQAVVVTKDTVATPVKERTQNIIVIKPVVWVMLQMC